jgi:membrane-associated phospholipid phosphatase
MKKFMYVFLIFLSLSTLNSAPTLAVSSQNQLIIQSQINYLDFVREQKLPPPQVAVIFGWANSAAEEAYYELDRKNQSNKQSHKAQLAFYITFHEFLANVYAKDSAQFRRVLNPVGYTSDDVYQLSLRIALKYWSALKPHLEAATKLSSTFELPHFSGEWKPTPPQFASPLYPHWSKIPLWSGVQIPNITSLLKPPQFASPTYMKEMQDVSAIGGLNSASRSAEQKRIALFWAGGPGSVTPPGMWIEAAIKLIEKHSLSERNTVSLIKILSQALSDASVVAWHAKYQFFTCRPATAIAHLGKDSNWQPLLITPPFPSWVSGHSTFSAAAATVLSQFFKPNELAIEFQSSENSSSSRRSYLHPWLAAVEAGASRIYGGIHFQSDNKAGLLLGHRSSCLVLYKNKRSCLNVTAEIEKL